MAFDPARSVFISGHRGMVGSALVRALKKHGTQDIITAPRTELDLTRQDAVEKFIGSKKPGLVIIAAARVGGIHANHAYRAEFIYENLMIAANISGIL